MLPGTHAGLPGLVGRFLHRFALRHAVDAVVTGPSRLLDEYANRYGLDRDRIRLACDDIEA